ncbi:MAG: PIN domain-containing protein [Candidatus Solibacter usitatus]|nr:PIN domain-containing protein [Candidatus Solibacter usitatus]
MILVDANLLIYSRSTSMPMHVAARRWLEEALHGPALVALPWASLLAFLRLTTNPRVFERPDSLHSAWRQVEEWLDCPNVWIPAPGEDHRRIFTALLPHATSANLIPDCHLAALAMEHGLTLCSADADFSRFPGLKWINPLAR